MIARLIAFECRQRLKLLSTYVYALVLFSAGAFLMLASGGVFRSIAVSVGSERVHANSPYALFQTTATVALLGLFTVAAVFGQAAHRDFEQRTWPLIFTTNVKPREYLLGRFAGAFVFSCVLFLSIGLGQALASAVVAFVKPARLGPAGAGTYLWPYVVQIWPMLFFSGALFFALAALSRRMAPVYVGAVVLVLGYLVASALVDDVESRTLAALLDPFGFVAFEYAVRYWTPVERNRDLVSLAGTLGANRALWCGVGVLLLALALQRFRPVTEEQGGKAKAREPHPAPTPTRTLGSTTTRELGSTRRWLQVTAATARLYCREITQSAVYWAFVLSGFSFLLIVQSVAKDLYGTPTLPVTYAVLEQARGAFRLFALATITFYAGELVFRERDARVSEVVDSTPAPAWVLLASKLLALWAVALSLVLAAGAAALVGQASRGFFQIDLLQYVVQLGLLEWTGLALTCVLAVTLQVLCNHKYVGHAAMVVYFMSDMLFASLGVEDQLVQYGEATRVVYSDMNGYGDRLWPWAWFRVYWSAFAALAVIGAYTFLQRGRESSWNARVRVARERFRGGARVAAAVAAGVWIVSGAFIFYNTHILHPYITAKFIEERQAEYERRYKVWQTRPQPRIVSARVKFDVFPEKLLLRAGGTYRIENKTAEAISRVLVQLPRDARVRVLRVAGASAPVEHEDTLGLRVYTLPKPLQPGASADLTFDMSIEGGGFKHWGVRREVVANGTFLTNFDLPVIGYDESRELERDEDREEYDLRPKQRMASRDDARAARDSYLRQDSDFIRLEAEVSTSPDQTPLAPGRLVSTWLAGGRRHARFEAETPMVNFFSVLSARYAVERDRFGDVALEIYHHPDHTWNVARMQRGMREALAYCTQAFGPYPHHTLRIAEFPRYATYAQAFLNTIPYSEAIGFIARVRDDQPNDVNYPYYVTAHEVAHQWWAHQVVGANVRGATMLSETLAQYSALMVMKHAYDAHHMRRFLKYELDQYLRGRATEDVRELPLAHNENQGYIHYNKGSLAMYALADYIGQERVDRALRRLLEAFRLRGPPYPTSADLLGFLREETPEEYRYLLEDLFETITLYDNRTEHASLKPAPDGGWDVTLRVVARKFRSGEHGEQTELDFADFMDVGALDGDGNATFLERRKISKGSSEQHFHVSERPAKVGVDPLNKLIDRQSDDNAIAPEAP